MCQGLRDGWRLPKKASASFPAFDPSNDCWTESEQSGMVPSLRMEGIEHPFRDQKQIVRFSAGFRTASNAPAWHQIFSRRERRCSVSLVSALSAGPPVRFQVVAAPRTACSAVAVAAGGALAAPHAPLAATRCTRHTAPYRTDPHCIAARGVHPARSTHPGTPVRAGCDSARHSAHAARGAVRAADGGCVQDAHCGIAKPPRAHARGVRGR